MCVRATWVDIRSVEKPEVQHSDAQPPPMGLSSGTDAGQPLGSISGAERPHTGLPS